MKFSGAWHPEEQILAAVELSGRPASKCLANPRRVIEMASRLAAKFHYDDDGFDLHTMFGTIRVAPDPDCPIDEFHLVKMKRKYWADDNGVVHEFDVPDDAFALALLDECELCGGRIEGVDFTRGVFHCSTGGSHAIPPLTFRLVDGRPVFTRRAAPPPNL